MELENINRFVSTLAGAFRSFYIYNQDNKAFDEILQNLIKRFQDTQSPPAPINLTITNRSLLYKGEPVGFQEITVSLASVLRNLGYKSIQIQAPLQTRHFFQLFHILTGKDSNDSKNEKLIPLMEDGEPKSISLVPLTANSYLLKLSDEVLARRLAPLNLPKAQGGVGLIEAMAETKLDLLPDVFLWMRTKIEPLPGPLKNFTLSFIQATQEGFFPWERFLALFPMPGPLRQRLQTKLSQETVRHLRIPTPLGHVYRKKSVAVGPTFMNPDWTSRLSGYSTEEVLLHQEFRSMGAIQSASQDLDLAAALVKEQGPNFLLGLALLLRVMSERNAVSVQEKALKLAIDVWMASLHSDQNANTVSLFSSLRHQLTSVQNVSLVLFPIRSATIESSIFNDSARYFVSLGKACHAPLIQSLDAEQDRGMRRKLCSLITIVARDNGAEVIAESLLKASPFLLRNLIMVLGDIRAATAIPAIIPFANHAQKIVRLEAVRALCKMGTDEAHRALLTIVRQVQDPELKTAALNVLTQTKYKENISDLLEKPK